MLRGWTLSTLRRSSLPLAGVLTRSMSKIKVDDKQKSLQAKNMMPMKGTMARLRDGSNKQSKWARLS
jgi:hypothetical protein